MTDKRITALIAEFFPCLTVNGHAPHLGCRTTGEDEHHYLGCPALFRYRAERLIARILRSERRSR